MSNKKIKTPFLKRIRNYFFTGAVVLIPIGITLYLTLFFIKISTKILPKELNPNNYLPIDIPGIEILISVILITFIGWLSLSIIGKRLIELLNSILKKIPILRTIYSAIGQMTETLTNKDDSQKSVVILEYPRKNVWVVGFATKANKGKIQKEIKRELINVFVPTTPNPTSGFLLMVPKEDLIFVDMSFEEASKFIVSAGTSDTN
tara:strand:+ start:2458 stop:3072 length:615 start_codon:yes stop_codon:yes gene_type:complete